MDFCWDPREFYIGHGDGGFFYVNPSVLRALHHVHRIGQNQFQRDDPVFRSIADPPVINFLGSWFWFHFLVGRQVVVQHGTTWPNICTCTILACRQTHVFLFPSNSQATSRNKGVNEALLRDNAH